MPPAAPSTIEAVAATGGPARVLAAQRTCSGGFADPGVSRDGAAVHAVSWRLRRGQPVAAVVHLPSRRTVGLPDRSVDPLLGPDGVHVAALEPAGVGLALVVRAVATGREVARVVHSGDPAFLDDFGIDRPVAWSADGRRLAVLLAGVRRDVLTVVDVPSGRTLVRRALRGASLGSDAFAADGASLALTAERHPSRPTARIHVVDVATGAVRRLGRWATAPSWGGVTRAPVGTRFAWSRPDAVVLAGRGERRALRVHALGRRVRVAGEPRFSPDGTRVAYVVAAGPGELARTGIAVQPVARAAGPPRLVVAFRRRGVGDPAWSPDGGALVFASG